MANVTRIGMVMTTYFVYIMTNKMHEVLYTGVTGDLVTHCVDHRAKRYPNSFTAQYNVNKLVYYEEFRNINTAIAREKQIKAGPRKKKIELIESVNPLWHDLFETKLGLDYL